MKRSIAVQALGLLVVFVVVFGVVGYLIGGWETARNFGLIAGPIFALCSAIPIIISRRRGQINDPR